MNRWTAFGLIVIFIAALGLRVPQLAQRPMHNDEAVNAVKFGALWEKGRYQYDPNEFHGPTLPYATLLPAALSGPRSFVAFSESTFRAVTVLFGAGLILLLPLLSAALGPAATLAAAALLALSPAMVFYSRYYIHEMLLVFFTLLLLSACWRYLLAQNLRWAVLGGIALGLMYATKETFVLSAAALAAGLGTAAIAEKHHLKQAAARFKTPHLIAALASALLVGLVLFSSFFTNPTGPLDSLRTYFPWLHRAGGASPHQHAWNFYFERLLFFHTKKGPFWSEAFIFILALIGTASVFRNASPISPAGKRLGRILAGYTASLTLIYTAISYKTPWCALSFWLGAILLAGLGVSALLQSTAKPWQTILALALLSTGAGHLAWQAWRASFPLCASPQNPYVYAQTSPDLLNLVQKINGIAAVDPHRTHVLIKVISDHGDYWPLPWYLRAFPRIGWWDKMPADPFAPIMIVSSSFDARFDERPNKTHLMAGYFQLRPQIFFELYVEINLWRAYVASLPPLQ